MVSVGPPHDVVLDRHAVGLGVEAQDGKHYLLLQKANIHGNDSRCLFFVNLEDSGCESRGLPAKMAVR